MSTVRELARFRSRRFAPLLPEACQLGPGSYGAELAFWLAGKLARHGVVTSYPARGEGGWLLGFTAADGTAFQVLCRNVDGSDEDWLLALVPCMPGHEAARPLLNAIRQVLHASVPKTDIAWLYEPPA